MRIETEGRSPHQADRRHAVHALVALVGELQTERGRLPRGARGVVHDRKPDGSLYLVEFDEPFFCVVEVPGPLLRDA